MKILVIGSGGQVGFELMRAPWSAGTTLVGMPHAQLDITDGAAVEHALAAETGDLVINAAGFTAVDRAEVEPDQAFAVNRDGAGNLAAACARMGVPMIHLSTDYVFDGTKPDPYLEEDLVSPINVYGASKAAGEDAVRSRLSRHLILRTSWVYGAHGRNFVKTMLRLARSQKEIRVVDDQIGCPTAAADLAGAIGRLAGMLSGRSSWGTYHLCGGGATTWFDFARHILAISYTDTDQPVVRAVGSREFGAPARRPENSRLECRRIDRQFGIACPPWEASLARVLPEIVASLT